MIGEAATLEDATEKKKRIHWDKSKKDEILAEGLRLKAANPKLSISKLIKLSQLVLEPEYRRNVEQFGRVPSNMWFIDAMEGSIPIDASLESRPILAEDMVLVQPPISGPEEDLDIPVSMLVSTLNTLIAHLQEDRELSRKDRDQVVVLGAEMKAGIERLINLERRCTSAIERLESVGRQGWQVVPLFGTPEKVPTAAEVARRVSDAPAKRYETRRPRVVVLNLPSGGEKYGCNEGAKSHCSALEYRDVEENKFPQFDQFDYVIVTKYVDRVEGWYKTAKEMDRLKNKLIHCPGTVRERIVPRIVGLPDIQCEVKNPEQ